MELEEGETYSKQGAGSRSEKIATLDYDEDRLHEMTASYSEISFDSQSSPPISELRSLIDSPDIDGTKFLDGSLDKFNGVGCRPDQLNLRNREGSPAEDGDILDPPSYHKAMGYLQLEGTVMQDGDMVLFVAEDLENKIKLSSPVTKKGETPSFPGSRSSTPCLYRQALTPQMPLLDHNVLNELEMEARKVATSVDALTENLAAILHSASALTVGCLETYRDAVCKTCDAVDHNIKSMYQLMAKCEELSKSMGPTYKLAEQMRVVAFMYYSLTITNATFDRRVSRCLILVTKIGATVPLLLASRVFSFGACTQHDPAFVPLFRTIGQVFFNFVYRDIREIFKVVGYFPDRLCMHIVGLYRLRVCSLNLTLFKFFSKEMKRMLELFESAMNL